MSWDEVDGVMRRAVARGLSRRTSQPLRHIGLDETSFQKRHEYVTVVYDTERRRMVEVLDGRTQSALEPANLARFALLRDSSLKVARVSRTLLKPRSFFDEVALGWR